MNGLNRSTGISNSMLIEPVVSSYIIETANKLIPKLSSGHYEISTKLLQGHSHKNVSWEINGF